MTPQPPDREAIDTARDLTGALTGLRQALDQYNRESEDRDEALAKYGKRNRRLVVADIAATLIAIISTVIALHANSDASGAQARAGRAYSRVVASHESQISGCEVGNQLRATQVQLWAHLAALSLSTPPPHLTAREIAKNKADVAAILAYVRRSFPQLNCQALYRIR